MAHRAPEPAGLTSRFSKETREYIYDVVAAGVPLLSITGLIVDNNVAQAILLFAAAVLGLGGGALARSNTVEIPKPEK